MAVALVNTLPTLNPKGASAGSVQVSEPPETRQDVGGLIAIACDPNDPTSVVVGTKRGEVIKVTQGEEPKLLSSAHNAGEVWAASCHPFDLCAVTAADDNSIRLWNLAEKRQTAVRKIDTEWQQKPKRGASSMAKTGENMQCRAICYLQDGSGIAAGLNNGAVLFMDPETLETKHMVPLFIEMLLS